MSLRKAASLGAIRMAVQMVASFLSVKVTSVYLGPAGIGLVGQLQSFMGMTLGVVSSGVNTGVIRLTAEYGTDVERRRKLVSTVVRALLVVGVPVSLLLLIGAHWIAGKLLDDVGYAPAVMLFGGLYLCGLFGSLLLGLANGAKDYMSTTYINIGNILAGLALFALLSPTYGVVGGLAAAALAPLMSLAIAAFLARGKPWFERGALSSGFSRVELRRVAGFIPMAVAGAVVTPLAQIMVRDTLAAHAGMEAVGLLQGVWRLSDLYLGIFVSLFSMYYLPRFAEIKGAPELRREIGRGLLYIVPAVALISTLIYLLRDVLIAVIFTHEFLPMRDLFAWQMVGNVLRMTSWLFGYVLVAKASPLLFAAIEISTGGAWVAFAYWFIPKGGAIGAVQSYVATYTFYLVITACLVFVITRKIDRESKGEEK